MSFLKGLGDSSNGILAKMGVRDNHFELIT